MKSWAEMRNCGFTPRYAVRYVNLTGEIFLDIAHIELLQNARALVNILDSSHYYIVELSTGKIIE